MNNDTRSTIRAARLLALLIGFLVCAPNQTAVAQLGAFAPGDVFVSLRTGQVQWWGPNGILKAVLVNVIPGKAEGMGFDRAGNLYVTHYCLDPTCRTGNSVEKFDSSGISRGAFGSGYNCNPYAIVFDAATRAFVGQADCTGSILRFDGLGVFQAEFLVAPDNRGSARIDLAPDACTMFYTSQGPNVKRFNICTNQQLPNFNKAPLPGGVTWALRILPDGGVLVACDIVIARLNAAGNLVQTYNVAGELSLWEGLDLAGDGTFWASNYGSSNVYRFDIATGNVLAGFNSGTPTTTVKDVLVKRP